MSTNARQAYLESEVLHADPIELIRILYRASIEAIDLAAQAINAKAIPEKTRQINKAQQIISELSLAVDHQKGGQVAKNLVELYDYVLHRLQEANFQCDATILLEAKGILKPLLEAWQECSPTEADALPIPVLPEFARHSVTY